MSTFWVTGEQPFTTGSNERLEPGTLPFGGVVPLPQARTATATYTATEQSMLQEHDTLLRDLHRVNKVIGTLQ